MNSFNIAEILDEAWSLTKRHYWNWLLVIVVGLLVPTIIVGIGIAAAVAIPVLGAIVILIGVLGYFYVFLGILRNAYNASEGAKPSLSVLFRSDRFWWFLVAGAVYIGIVVAGSIRFDHSRFDLRIHVCTISVCLDRQPWHDRFRSIGT